MSWSIPSNNTGILVRPDATTSFILNGAGPHDIISAEPFGGGSLEVVQFRNDGGGRYLFTVRATGNPLLRLHGMSVD